MKEVVVEGCREEGKCLRVESLGFVVQVRVNPMGPLGGSWEIGVGHFLFGSFGMLRTTLGWKYGQV